MEKNMLNFIIREDGTETLEMLIVAAIAAGLVAVVVLLKDKFVETAKSTTTGL